MKSKKELKEHNKEVENVVGTPNELDENELNGISGGGIPDRLKDYDKPVLKPIQSMTDTQLGDIKFDEFTPISRDYISSFKCD